MPIQPKHRLDDSRPKAARQFTDREEFIESFQKALKGIKPDEQNVVVFYGVGGIGKTSLRKELGRILEKEQPKIAWTVLDFSIPQYREQETALFTFRKSLGEKYKIPFPSFDLAYAVYWQKTHPQTPLTKENFPLLDVGGIVTDIVGLFEVIPGIGLIPKVSNLVIKGKKGLEDWWTKRGNKELYDLPQMEPKDILERLPMFWATDLKDSLEQKDTHAVLFIDTYEALWGKERTEATVFKRDEWVRELVAQLPGILWIICGREKLRWEEVEGDWGKALNQHLLGGLADEDAKRFLTSCGIKDNAIQRVIIESSKGVPYCLDLAVDTYFEIKSRHQREPQTSDFATTHQEIVERFLLYLDRTEIETLKVLAVARKWDKSIFELLVTQFKTGYPVTALEELCRFSFINRGDIPSTWMMHELMRESLQQKQGEDRQKEIHRLLFNLHNERLGDVNINNISNKQKDDFSEAFYHGKEVLAANDLFNWFIKIADIYHSAAEWRFLEIRYNELIVILEKGTKPDQLTIASALSKLGRLNGILCNFIQAEINFERAQKILVNILGPDHPSVSSVMVEKAFLYSHQGKYEEADKLHKEALKIQVKAFGCEHETTSKTLNGMAINLSLQKMYPEAEILFKQTLAIDEKLFGKDHIRVATKLNNLSEVYIQMGKYEEAGALVQKALAIREKELGPRNSVVAASLNTLGRLFTKQNKFKEAETHYRRALEIMIQLNAPELYISDINTDLADLYKLQGRYGDAEPLYHDSLLMRGKIWGNNHPDLVPVLEALAEIYKKTGREEEAVQLEIRADGIRSKK